jgi:hypothetical protein
MKKNNLILIKLMELKPKKVKPYPMKILLLIASIKKNKDIYEQRSN